MRPRPASSTPPRATPPRSSPRASAASPHPIRRALLLLLVAATFGALALWWSLPDVRALAQRPPTTTAFIELRRQEAQAAGRHFVLHRSWRPLARISLFLQEAVILSEDARFWQHDGVDWDALEQAAKKDLHRGRLAMGGSTITQQLAKNLYLSPSKNPLRKLREIAIARLMEARLDKDRLLELYLNVVEWGDGVFGAEAAAQRWFGCTASQLTPMQAARLAVALPNPRLRSPAVHSRDLDAKAARLVRAMEREGLVDPTVAPQVAPPPAAGQGWQPPPPASPAGAQEESLDTSGPSPVGETAQPPTSSP